MINVNPNYIKSINTQQNKERKIKRNESESKGSLPIGGT